LSKHSLKRSSIYPNTISAIKQNDLKKQLLVIKNLADNYPNSGSLIKTLNNFDKDLDRKIKGKSKEKNYSNQYPQDENT
jgi:hypothetical protein